MQSVKLPGRDDGKPGAQRKEVRDIHELRHETQFPEESLQIIIG